MIHNGWSVRALSGPGVPDVVAQRRVPATVPGCVHTDLLAAGLVPDPYLDDNEVRQAWIGHTDWMYETRLHWRGHAGGAADASGGTNRVDLVCEGLDTVATITLNGVELGRTANMHRSYRFDARAALRPGENDLAVTFGSAYAYAERMRAQVGDRPGAYGEPYQFIRKMACNFGWDWGPNLVTAGIWRPIGLHEWRHGRLAQVRPLVTVEPGGGGTGKARAGRGRTGRVQAHVTVERASELPLVVVAEVNGVSATAVLAPGERTAVLTLGVDDPELWWPRGHGAQARYPLTVTLSTQDGDPLDRWQRRIGFRSVRLDTTPDADGTPYTVVVNDTPIFVRGVNWIPDDAFPSRIGPERYAERLTQAAAANVNYLRIWGGGIYESDDFYDAADELGLMVGQDFLFACAAYPEEEPFASEVAAEAREQVVRLAHHPSLVTWTGNNENIWGWHDWDWRESLGDRSWGGGFYFNLLPDIVAELDPTRPYWPGSPYSGRLDVHPNEPAHGSMHIWNVWNHDDYVHYRDYHPRFVAEFGYQAPPAYATLRRALSDDPLAPDSPGMRHHQKADDGDGKLSRGLAPHLPVPRTFADWHFLTQLNQARAIALGVEHLRSLRPYCMGAVVWQLNDCWPVTSWSAVDGDGRRKPLWYALRRAFADRLLTIQPRGGGLALVAVNDGGTDWTGLAEVTRHALSGEALGKFVVALDVAAYSAVLAALPADLVTPQDPRGELLRAQADGLTAWWGFAEDREIAYPAARFAASTEPVDGGFRVTVTAETVLRDLVLYPDRLDPAASVDEALVTLLPGESHTFTVHTGQTLDAAALTGAPVLRCVNDIALTGDTGVADDGGTAWP